MQKLLLKNSLCPGDVVTLTAAVRDLHRAHPGRFLTDVRTPFPTLWEHNPYLTRLDEKAPGVEVIEMHYPLIHACNTAPFHFIHGFSQFLAQKLQLPILPTEFKGDIHLSDDEKLWSSQVHELTGEDTPFWIIGAGGKYDVTIKWWDHRRYQRVVDHFKGRIQFVQVGKAGDYHPRLDGVIDLRERTDLRQLIRLVYHSQGVLCGVTALMHLAAAIETRPGQPKNRPCVVVAGGREPSQWEAYPHHQYLHTNGALLCCDQGGCWKSRTVPLGDGNERDNPGNLCLNVSGHLPRCMDMITADDVIRRIETYFDGGAVSYLPFARRRRIASAVRLTAQTGAAELEQAVFRRAGEMQLRSIPRYPGGHAGRGIVICGGGDRYLGCAWVCIRMLRQLGCSLPIQLWHLGPEELDADMARLLQPHGVECVDALTVREQNPVRRLGGWELKPFALLHCPFREVLLLDADNVPVKNPEYLFDTPEFLRHGAVFWPDYGRLGPERGIWNICGVPYRDEPEFESGQILLDKRKCWKALNLAMWYNEHSDYFYRHIHGDKDTFHLAWHKAGKSYAMPERGIHTLHGTMCQHDFAGERLFQHRNCAKWALWRINQRVSGFYFEKECLAAINELRSLLQQIVESRDAVADCSLPFANGVGWKCRDVRATAALNQE
jgi:ADP-heptose:LPS heptosyltransferase